MPFLPDTPLGQAIAVAILLVGAWAADRIAYRVILGVIRRMASRTKSTWDDRIIERKVFSRLAHTVPGVIVYYGIGPALGLSPADVLAQETTLAFGAALTQRVALAFIVSASLTPLRAQDPTPEPEVDRLDVELDRLEAEGEENAQDLLKEIRENMKTIERLLDRKDTGAETQATQVQTIERIEDLIEVLNKT